MLFGANANHGCRVYGTFKTETGNFPFVRLMDGSMFDMKAWNEVFNTASTSTHQSGFKLIYDEGATIGVKLGGRKISRNTPVISWTAATAPDATVKFIRADEGRRLTFIKKDDGLYVLSGFMIIVE